MEREMQPQPTFEEAERAASEIADRVREHGLEPALAELDNALKQFSDAGYPIESLVNSRGDSRLGMSLTRARDGKSFWTVYSEVIREELCKKDGELPKLVKAGLSGSTGALLTALMTGLALPGAAMAIMVPIAAILAAKGVDAFCRFTEEDSKGGT